MPLLGHPFIMALSWTTYLSGRAYVPVLKFLIWAWMSACALCSQSQGWGKEPALNRNVKLSNNKIQL